MRSSFKSALIGIAGILSLFGLIIVGGIWLANIQSDRSNWEMYQRFALQDTYAPATFDQAKDAALKVFDQYHNDREKTYIHSNYISVGTSYESKFDDTEVLVNKVHMLLSKSDYFKYLKWLKEFSKPYCNGTKLLHDPVPAPWGN